METGNVRNAMITTPKSDMAGAAQEAADCVKSRSGTYFRRFPLGRAPKVEPGSKMFYVEDGFIRGFCTVVKVEDVQAPKRCSTTGRIWNPGSYVIMNATTWKWIKPIPMTGFQGFRYVNPDFKYEVVGNWKDKKPEI